MLRILIIGCGDVGLRIAKLLRGRARLYALSRSPGRRAELRAAGVTPVAGDLDDPDSLERLAGLADVVLHLAPPPAEGATDRRTRRLLAALGRGSLSRGRAGMRSRGPAMQGCDHGGASTSAASEPARLRPLQGRYPPLRGRSLLRLPRALIYISTSGVYGDCAGDLVPETTPSRPRNARARRRHDAEQRLRAWAARHGVRLSILRAPGIYAAGRMPEERVRQGLPALRPEEDIYTNHIHAGDLARLVVAALFRGRANRLYNAVDDSGLKMGDWFDLVADHLGLPRPPRLSRAEVEAAVTPAMRSFLAESRRLSNRRIKAELRFRFRYPTVREGLAED